MLNCLRILIPWISLLTIVRAADVESTLHLFCEMEQGRWPIASIAANGGIQVDAGGKAVGLPEKFAWRLDGDLRDNAAFFHWSPSYRLMRRSEPMIAKEPDRPFQANVTMHYAPTSNSLREWAGGGLRTFWPSVSASNEAVVVAWIAQRRITQVQVRALQTDAGAVEFEFPLTPDEAEGQPAVLLWADGRLRAPLSQFADSTITPQALMAALLDDWAALEPLVQADRRLGSRVSVGGAPLLHLAAEAGALTVVQGLVAADPKAKPKNERKKQSVMDWAAGNGRIRVIEFLLEKGFPKNAKDQDGRTALLRAARGGHTEIVALLLKAGADANLESMDHRLPITEAIDLGYADIVRLLAPKAAFQMRDRPDNRAVLQTQAQKGHAEMVGWLLDQGISPNTKGPGLSALAHAAREGHGRIVEILIKGKADLAWADEKTGNTALMYAVARDNADCVELLLAAGANVNARNKSQANALHFAATHDSAKCAELLMSRKIERGTTTKLGLTALEIALLGQNETVAEVLTRHGERINLKFAEVALLVEAVLRVDNATLISRAIEDGLSPDLLFPGEWPMLLAARQLGAEKCVQVLLNAGAKRDATGPDVMVSSREIEVRPKVLKVVIPPDPRDAGEQFEAQVLLVELLIDGKGEPHFPRILKSPDKRLALALLDCLPQWRFSPAMKDGVPVAVRIHLPVQLPSSERRVYPLTAVDEMPKPIRQAHPHYPLSSRMSGEQARVLVRFVVNEQGAVEKLEVMERSSAACAEAATKAVSTWKYTPGTIAGKPVSVEMNLPIIFSLTD